MQTDVLLLNLELGPRSCLDYPEPVVVSHIQVYRGAEDKCFSTMVMGLQKVLWPHLLYYNVKKRTLVFFFKSAAQEENEQDLQLQCCINCSVFLDSIGWW